MKRVVLILLSVLFTATCFAKAKISVDKMKDGYRFIQTERTPHIFPYKDTWTDAAISLDLMTLGDLKKYSICVYLFAEVNIEKGAKMLLKLENDEIIELVANSKSETIRNLVFTVLQIITFADFSVTESQLQKIMENKVVKVRVETSIDNIDGAVYGNKFTKTIIDDYKLIEKTLQKKNSVYDDF